jgi:hypothetical protein
MSPSAQRIDVYLEIGKKRTLAGALDWPGWCRAGRDEPSALQALAGYGPRYARTLAAAQIDFHPPADTSALSVVERLEGKGTTDYGVPDIVPATDSRPVDAAELRRFESLLKAYWQAFDAAVAAAAGRELRKGPRGGGRELEGIVEHVLGAEAAYLTRLAWKWQKPEGEELSEQLRRTRQAVLDGLAAAARGETPSRGPRGGVLWPPRFFVRRAGWHVLDHIWEIEDRLT